MEINRKAIKIAMAERGLNQKELASLAGLEKATLSCILTGKSGGRPETWNKIANALGVSVLDILII